MEKYDIEFGANDSILHPTKKTAESDTSSNSEDKTPERAKWASQVEFMLSCVGYAVGLTNIWRFPYLCMRNGGGAFLIPYFASLFICGMPLFFLELVIGQFSSMSPMQIWCICPLFTGLGYGMVILSGIVCIYYNIIISWALFYLFKSFAKSLPWARCGNEWNTPLCLVRAALSTTNMTSDIDANYTLVVNDTELYAEGSDSLTIDRISSAREYANISSNQTIPWKMPAEEFWEREVLQLTPGIHDLGGMKWDLLGFLLLSWVIVFLCLSRGVKTSGKVVYVTATAPYIFLTILLIRGVLLPGAIEGIKYYVIPDWKRLLEFEVWAEAMMQIFYSLGPGWGGLITMASFNKFNNNVLRDGIVVPIVTCLSSFYGGFVIFSIIGFMAHKANVAVKDVITSGPGLVFIAYPEALSHLPVSPFWSILFFIMFLTVGIDTQFGMFETMSSSVVDQFPRHLRKNKLLFTAAICIVEFLIGIPLATRGGMYIFQIVDWYVAFSVMFIALFECMALAWAYGLDKLYYDIEIMTGKKPGVFWKICWGYINPALLLLMSVYSLAKIKQPTFGDYTYPKWAIGFGWCVSMCSFIPIPICFVVVLLRFKGNILQRLKLSLQPTSAWGPSDAKAKAVYNYRKSASTCPIQLPLRTRTDTEDICKGQEKTTSKV